MKRFGTPLARRRTAPSTRRYGCVPPVGQALIKRRDNRFRHHSFIPPRQQFRGGRCTRPRTLVRERIRLRRRRVAGRGGWLLCLHRCRAVALLTATLPVLPAGITLLAPRITLTTRITLLRAGIVL